MRKTRWLISVLIVLAVVSVLLFSLLYFRSFSEPRLTLEVEKLPRQVTTPTIVLRGQVSREAEIELSRGMSSLGTVELKKNKFEAEVELEPGENEIRVLARPKGEKAIQARDEVVHVRWEPKKPPVPALHLLPATINVPAITVTGLAYPNAEVDLEIASETEVNQRVFGSTTANKDGTFAKKMALPGPGTYKVTAVTRNSYGAKSAPTTEVKTVYDPEWYPQSKPLEAQNSRRMIRKADLVLRHKQLLMTYEVTLPKDDPAVTKLMANQGSLSDFFHETFGLAVNGYFRPTEFDNTVPEVVFKDQNATIKATTLPHRAVRDFLPVLRGQLNLLGTRGFPFANPGDRLSLSTYDYTVESIGQPPSLVEGNTLTWTGGDSATTDPRPQIKLKLAYKPFASPRNFLRLAQVSPYNLWQYPGNTIPHLIIGLCSLIPMLWVIWLVADWRLRFTIDSALRNDLHKLSVTLIVLSLVHTLLNTSRGLAYLGWDRDVEEALQFIERYVGPVDNYLPILEVLAAVAILLLALLIQFITARVSRRLWVIWVRRISDGVVKAALICILLELTWFIYINPALTRVPNVLIMLATLGYLFFRTAQVVRHANPKPQHKRRLIVLLVIVGLMFVVPSAMTPSKEEANLSISQLFSMLGSLLPYALAAGLMVVLKRLDSVNQRVPRQVVLTIGLILFSGFLVGTTSNLFMIPVPFIIAIWMYKRFLIHDFKKAGDLDFVNNEVVKERLSLIEGVLTHETAQHFNKHIEKLKDKVTSGDMTPKEFEDRKAEIQQYVNAKKAASTHSNGLHAKTTVLGIGPNIKNWLNGMWCLRWGGLLITPFLFGYLLLLLLRPTAFSESVLGFMFGLNQLATFVAHWLLAAFFFGYFFRYIQGDSGLQKGLRTAILTIICLLPVWVTGLSHNEDWIGALFGAGQTFLFFTLLGMGAFDYTTFRGALRDRFRWRTFARFGDMPSFTAVASVLVTSIGVVLSRVFNEKFEEFVTTLFNAVFQSSGLPK